MALRNLGPKYHIQDRIIPKTSSLENWAPEKCAYVPLEPQRPACDNYDQIPALSDALRNVGSHPRIPQRDQRRRSEASDMTKVK